MTAAAHPPDRRRATAAPLLGAVAAAVLLALFGWAAPQAALRGWVAGWSFAVSACLGAAVLLHIHALTGGRWRMAGQPWLPALAALTPWAALGGLVLLAAREPLYPWAQSPPEAEFQKLWFSDAFYLARGAGVLVVWALIGLAAPRTPRPGFAAVWLILYAVSVSFAGVDWLLSVDPQYVSTVFGAIFAVSQIGTALALCAALGLRVEGGPAADWGGLLMAALLGVFYLSAMQYLVSWSGDLPHKAAWYEARNVPSGAALIGAAAAIGLLAPFVMMLPAALRSRRAPLRLAGAAALTGAWLHLLWIVLSWREAPFPWASACAAALATALFALLAAPVLRRAAREDRA